MIYGLARILLTNLQASWESVNLYASEIAAVKDTNLSGMSSLTRNVISSLRVRFCSGENVADVELIDVPFVIRNSRIFWMNAKYTCVLATSLKYGRQPENRPN